MPYAGQMDWDANGTLQIGDLMSLTFLSSYCVQMLPTRRVICAIQIPESHSAGISKDTSSFPSPRTIISIPFPNVPKHESQILHGSWIFPLFSNPPIPNNSDQAQEYSAGIPESKYVPTSKIYSASHLFNQIVRQKRRNFELRQNRHIRGQEQSISTSSLRLRNPASPKSMPPEADSRFISYPHPPKAMLPEADSRPMSYVFQPVLHWPKKPKFSCSGLAGGKSCGFRRDLGCAKTRCATFEADSALRSGIVVCLKG